MSKVSSPYYPPRARWYGGVFTFGSGLRRRLALDRARRPSGIPLAHVIGGLLVPGLGFALRGPQVWGLLAVALCAVLLGVFVIWLGYPAGNLAFGTLLSVHATGLVYLLEPWLAGGRFRTRVGFSLAVLIVLGALVYLPARSLLQNRWLMPLQLRGRVVVVRPLAPHAADRGLRVHRGDWVAYSLSAAGVGEAYVPEGLGLGPVLAGPGDEVRFTGETFQVNGVSRPRLAYMPRAGEWVVPEKHWFIWPDLAISGHGNVPEATITAALLKMATVSEEQLVGKPFKRWLWRPQLPA